MKSSTQRFSDRVADYIRYRPTYPSGLLSALQAHIGLSPDWRIADMGCGTGLSARPFLDNGNPVLGVEPNAEMLSAAQELLKSYPNFSTRQEPAERTSLPDQSIDLIISGQAFHWFDRERVKTEWRRILRPEGHIALVWNQRDRNDAFQAAYELVLHRHIEAYKNVRHRNLDPEELFAFFSPRKGHVEQLVHTQRFDLESLQGRLRSSSYCPKSGSEYGPLMAAVEKLFEQFEQEGKIVFRYQTFVYWC
ncbi:MAG: class I SAM-dependent methyltransferase [Bacteroidota bacterium]